MHRHFPIFEEPATSNIVYNDARPLDLLEIASEPENDFRVYAAAGVTRCLLDTRLEARLEQGAGFIAAINYSTELIQAAIRQEYALVPDKMVRDIIEASPTIRDGYLDNTTIQATNFNKEYAARSASTVETIATRHKQRLIIALGHGGILSSMYTYLALKGGGNSFYPVLFSTQKSEHLHPQITPFEIDYLDQLARQAAVIVHDEDTCTNTTLEKASVYFSQELDTSVTGFAPVQFYFSLRTQDIGLGGYVTAFSAGQFVSNQRFAMTIEQKTKLSAP